MINDMDFQARVGVWLMECFGHAIAHDGIERNHRFLEESLELVQSLGCTASEAHQLVDYVFGRPIGEPKQELGGVMVTLAALCFAHGLGMQECGETELERISAPETMAKVKAKQAAKPKHSPLPEEPSRRDVDLPDVEDMAHSALEEALSFGLSHDVLHRWMRKVMTETKKAISIPHYAE